MDDQITLTAYTDQVRALLRHERTDEAIAICKHILRFYPKYIDAYRQMGEAYLEQGDYESAKDLFRRVLSADPENVVAYIGLATIFEKEYVINEAVWYMERAYELAPGNPELQQELVRLYDALEPQAHRRAHLTPGALARIYAQEGLFSQAIQEFRAIMAVMPARFDIQVALAETLWRIGKLSEATQVAQSILEQLPYCLKANLILGAAWKEAGLPDSDVYLQRAQALDPMNRVAAQVLGAHSPLPLLEPTVPRYIEPPVAAAPPTPESAPTEFGTPSAPAVSEASWQEALETPTVESPVVSEPAAEPTPSVSETQLPPWLRAEGAPAPAEIPDWLKELEQAEPAAPVAEPTEAVAPAEEIPDWLKGLPAEPAASVAEPTEAVAPAEEIPDWLKGSAPTEPAEATVSKVSPEAEPTIEEAAPTPAQPITEAHVASAEEGPKSVQEPAAPAEPPPVRIIPPEEELPPWLQGFEELGYKRTEEPAPSGQQPSAVEPIRAEGEATPSWLTQAEQPAPTEQATELPTWGKVPTPEPTPPAIEEPFLGEKAQAQPEVVAPEPTPPAPSKRKRQPKGYSHLVQARAYRDANRWEEALAEYDYVVQHAPRLVAQVIDDLEILIQRLDVPLDAHRILGDAYTRADRLAEALERYRFVLEHISSSNASRVSS